MPELSLERRNFLKIILGGISMAALDWSVFPVGTGASTNPDEFDAVIIGSGLGGLSCAAAFARQGFRPLVIEQHSKAGGYATSFKRPGGFEFDVSLHSTTVGERNGIHNLIPGFPELDTVEFVPHPDLYRVIFPDYDIRVAQKDLPAYINQLVALFPEEEAGIRALFKEMKDFLDDFSGFMQANAQGGMDMSEVPVKFPLLAKYSFMTWGGIVDGHLKNPKLKAIVSAQWGYYGLPPYKLASFYYAMPYIGYLEQGGYYPRGRSQTISDAFVNFIETRGGQVMLKTKVDKIMVKDHAAYGVRTKDGREYKGRVVVSNANAIDTFRNMMNEEQFLKDYLGRLDGYSMSQSCFQVFLGLNRDLVGELGLKDSEIFFETGYDADASYQNIVNADVEKGGFGLTLYDNLYKGYSPAGKNTVNILTLQGYDHWQPFEKDYFAGNKSAYQTEKNRLAEILIKKVEDSLMPGLSKAIEVKEIGTPLTNIRYTGHPRGAMYGWDQTLNNSGGSRVGNSTPIKNLFLAGAWSHPGHGYGGVLYSGLQCFREIMREW
jgi:all-trans-retinol 13,14-reductase